MNFPPIPRLELLFFALGVLAVFGFAGEATASGTAREDLEFHVMQEGGEPLGIEDVCCGRTAFGEDPVTATGAGFGGKPLWLKLPPLRPGTILVISKAVDVATLYEETSGGWIVSQTGDIEAPSGAAIPAPQMAFFLAEDAKPDAARFLRVVQPSPIRFQLSVWELQAFRSASESRRIVQMLLLGFIAAIVAYNLVVSALTRDVVFAFNALSIVALFAVDLYLSGLGAFYIWPRPLSNVILIAALAAATVFGSLFISHFLFLDIRHRSARPLVLFAGASVIMCASMLFLPYWYPQTALIACGLAMIATAVGITFIEIVRGNPNAPLLAVPLLGMILPGGFLVALRSYTAISLGPLQPHILELALALEALAFSLALAARIRSQKFAVMAARAELAETQKESARRYADLQERERARIAADLHDSIGHNLVIISALIENSLKGEGRPEDARSAVGLTRRAIQQVRQLSHALHPATLSDLGWNAAIDALFGDLQRSTGIEVEIEELGGAPNLPDDAKLDLYRILQELSSNLAKHSGASRCVVSFDNHGEYLKIRIADDGVGLPQGKDLRGGLGFTSIEERLKTIGGTWTMERERAIGFEVVLVIPTMKTPNDA